MDFWLDMQLVTWTCILWHMWCVLWHVACNSWLITWTFDLTRDLWHELVSCDMWCVLWHVACNSWLMTCDMNLYLVRCCVACDMLLVVGHLCHVVKTTCDITYDQSVLLLLNNSYCRESSGTFAENQKIMAIRRVYQVCPFSVSCSFILP